MLSNTLELRSTREFEKWRESLRDQKARLAIARRVQQLRSGNAGVFRSVGEGVLELKIDFGPGYRVYYLQRGQRLVLLLCGGDKSSQDRDIQRAKLLARRENDQDAS